MPYKAISYQSHQRQTKCLQLVQNKAAQNLNLDRKGKMGWIESWMSEKTKEMCARPRRRFSAGEMGEEGFEVRNEKTVGRLEPKPCFT